MTKPELTCEIVQDLLPSYVEGLTSEATNDAVQAHLEGCGACRALCGDMKENPKPSSSPEDEALMKKLRRRLNRKTRRVIAIAAAAVALVAGGAWLLFDAPLREIPVEALKIKADVYDLRDIAAPAENGTPPQITVGESDDSVYTITFPDSSARFTCTEGVLENAPYVTTYSLQSAYWVRSVRERTEERDGKKVLVVSDARATLLGGTVDGGQYQGVSLLHDALDEIVYAAKDGAETVLWTRG